MKLARPIGFSLFSNIRCAGGTTDLFSRSPFVYGQKSASALDSGAFFAWDDPELCELVEEINQRFGNKIGDDIEEA